MYFFTEDKMIIYTLIDDLTGIKNNTLVIVQVVFVTLLTFFLPFFIFGGK